MPLLRLSLSLSLSLCVSIHITYLNQRRQQLLEALAFARVKNRLRGQDKVGQPFHLFRDGVEFEVTEGLELGLDHG